MTEGCQFHLLTFVTKYSRIPSEEIGLLRYSAMLEIGKEPLILDTVWCKLIWNAIKEQAHNLGIKIIVAAVLLDHVHIVIDSNDKSISEIVQKLKWYSSYTYNRMSQHKGSVWAVWYSNTYLDNTRHLENAVEYVKNNHLKHQAKSYYVRWESI